MTTMHIRQCPRCELRFTSSSELQDHLTNDHRPRRDASDAVVVPAPGAPHRTPVAAPPPVARPATAHHLRALTSALALIGLVLIALVAWLAPTSTALITSASVVLLALCYLWRARIRTRMRRR
jgi:hypothetical protein